MTKGKSIHRTTPEELLQGALENHGFAAEYARQRVRRSLSEALFRLRRDLGLTQTVVAEAAGWRQPYVARLEGNPSDAAGALERIEKFANACGASAMLLFVDRRTGSVKQAVSVGEDENLRQAATNMVGASVAAVGGSVKAPEVEAVVLAVEEADAAVGLAHERLESLRSHLDAIQVHELKPDLAR